MKTKQPGENRNYILLIALLAVVTGCSAISEGLKKRVTMEYDQRLNFHKYDFSGSTPSGVPSAVTPNGVWLLYHICSLKNDASEAQNFNFDVRKFYVVAQDGKKYYADDLKFPDLVGQDGFANYAAIDNEFRSEVQTAPMTKFIAANSAPMFALSWRFAILIENQSVVDWMSSSYDLRYDNSGGESILMLDRGHVPDVRWIPNVTSDYHLTNQCRPKLK